MASPSKYQALVESYLAEVGSHSHVGGYANMFDFHANWHLKHVARAPSPTYDCDWGCDDPFGGDFLTMHHNMLWGTKDDPNNELGHDGFLAWLRIKHKLTGPFLDWRPQEDIPSDYGYNPNPNVFPLKIQNQLVALQIKSHCSATGEGRPDWPGEYLRRTADGGFPPLRACFTEAGGSAEAEIDPYTGHKRLADFKNINQLGCSLAGPHGEWHALISGAMLDFGTAIADPIFYFGVHSLIDGIFQKYLAIEQERSPAERAEIRCGMPPCDKTMRPPAVQDVVDKYSRQNSALIKILSNRISIL
ncbi:MAG: hypothetical protein NVS9B10_17140 [Nevskia sp.]